MAIPVAGIGHVALLAMEMRMHPIAVRLTFMALPALVSLLPIVLEQPPQPLQGRTDIRRR